MRVSLSLLFALGVGLLGVSCSGPVESPREVFGRFSQALEKGDFAVIDEVASANSKKRFDALWRWVIVGDEEGIRRLPAFDRYLALKCRMGTVERDEATWRRLYAMLDSERANGLNALFLKDLQSELSGLRLGEVSVSGSAAGAPLHFGDSVTDMRLDFVKEADGWKVDIERFYARLFDAAMERFMGDAYRNRDRVEEMFRERFGEAFSSDLYEKRVLLR